MDWRELGIQGSKKKEPSLESTKKALEALGRPDQDYEVVLVGGTNGKGSTVEMLSELLQENGNKVGVNKSPHLVRPHERVRINSKDISEEDFDSIVNEIKSLDIELSFFEVMTVIAFKHFSDQDVDIAVMEVGMGGRLDATNAAENKFAAITDVAEDHQKYLGETLEEIAREKAGIIPENGSLVSGSDIDVIRDVSRERSCSFHRPVTIDRFNGEIFFRGEVFDMPVKGSFQVENLSVALKLAEVMNEMPDNIGNAIEKVECRGRMEKISEKPFTVVDGAHNAEAIRRIVDEFPDRFVCVFSCTETKNAQKMIEDIESKSREIIFTDSGIEWAEDPEKLEEKSSGRSRVIEDPAEALEHARVTAGQEGCVLVTGSLYLVGKILELEE